MPEFMSQEILDRLKDWFTRLTVSMQGNRALKHQDANIRVEDFFCDLLNAVYGWNLVNANGLISGDQDTYDLCDQQNQIAVQVTVTTSPAKIKKTLRSFVGAHKEAFTTLKFAYPVMEVPKSAAKFDAELGDFDFVVGRDRIDFRTILSETVKLPLVRQKVILELVAERLEPLGRALHLGTDDMLDTLIDVIKYMTENTPADQVQAVERDPDYQQKRQRLAAHVDYLEQQYAVNAPLHATADTAREAIGYDQAVAAKVQAWLMGESISKLHEYGNDAGKAFDMLVIDLLAKAHQRGGTSQVSAVRFLLADEFQRCNVFPNP